MKTLKFANFAKVGQKIRAYDFKPMNGREDMFVEGIVLETCNTENGYNAYAIRVTKDCDGDRIFTELAYKAVEHHRVGDIVYVPHQVSFMEYDARIMNLSQ
jgi:hypothetical protein